MQRNIIQKSGPVDGAAPNLADYEQARATFSWEAARRELDGLPGGGGLNIAHEAVDRHADGPLAGTIALRCIGADGGPRDYTFSRLRDLSNRFANALRGLGVGKGDRVFTLTGRIPELYVTALATLKNGSVLCPLFAAFGPEPIHSRMTIGGARILLTTRILYERKIVRLRDSLPGPLDIILVDPGGGGARQAGVHEFNELLDGAAGTFPSRPPIRRTWRCCISPAARRAGPRGRCMSMPRSSPITSPAGSHWICGPGTSTGARRTRAG